MVLFLCLIDNCSGPVTTTTTTVDDVTSSLTTNSTQTPSDMSPTPVSDSFPQAHHQNPGHCMASFAAINQMRQSAQVIKHGFLFFILEISVAARIRDFIHGMGQEGRKFRHDSSLPQEFAHHFRYLPSFIRRSPIASQLDASTQTT